MLGHFGFTVDVGDDDSRLAAAEIERLGFSALWIAGGQLDRLDRLTELLEATRTAVVGPAIISPDVYAPAAVSQLYGQAESYAPGRLIIGLGSSQQAGALAGLARYLDQLDGVPRERRLLAALGPRALGVARNRFGGAMPMLLTPDHTTVARRLLGPDATLAVGLYAVLDDSAARARAAARQPLSFLSTLPGFAKSLARQGFSDQHIGDLADHLVDALVAWGSPEKVIDHAHQLLEAGADHVQLTVLGTSGQPTGVAAARLLATSF